MRDTYDRRRGYICMAVYRPDLELLRIQIGSIISQTAEDWTCLVGIDGADSATATNLKSLIAGDQRFIVLSYESRVGFYRNFERILAEVPQDAAWVALSDQDDEWEARKLEVLIPRLARSALVVGQARIRQRQVAGSPDDPPVGVTRRRVVKLNAMMIDNQVTGSLAVLRGELLQRALPFPAATDLSYHDHWLAVCALLGDGIEVVPIVVQEYIQHAGNVIGESSRIGIRERLRHLKKTSGHSSLVAQLDYVSTQRWGWRVNMARTAIQRFESLPVEEKRILIAFTKNRLTCRFFVASILDVLARSVPRGRALALIAGSLRAPWTKNPILRSSTHR